MLRKRIQLGLIHVAVAITLVPINSTLNRVMIKELEMSAFLVSVMAALPYFFSPIQVAIGAFSDRHPIAGYYRTPYILLGLILCVAGLAIAPQAVFLMTENFVLGLLCGFLAFGAWGMGYNLSAVSYLSLASELSGEKGRSKTVSIMWFMMIVGIILTAILISRIVDPYTPERLQQAFWLISAIALVVGLLSLIRLEERKPKETHADENRYTWMQSARAVLKNKASATFFLYLTILLIALLGQDILLEPYAAEAFGMSVKETTRITSYWGVFVLTAIIIAGFIEGKLSKKTIAFIGGTGALAGFLLIAVTGIIFGKSLFYVGVFLLGLGTGLSTVSNLSLMLDMTTAGKVGAFMGAWGMANAISRLVGTLMSGVVRDVLSAITNNPLVGYISVFALLAICLAITLIMLNRIDVQQFKQQHDLPLEERAAIALDAG